jgi:hypothetical protein
MAQTDLENDPFLVLLTDALRAGPGSPQWHEAVAKLKTSTEPVDEYRLLIDARQSLESGKEYRSVRAGPGFTRKVLEGVEHEQPATRRAFPITGTIILSAVVVILGVVGIIVYELYPRGPVAPSHTGVDELSSTYFPTTVLSSSFDTSIPIDWRQIGSLPVEASKGLRAGEAVVPPDGYIGGGIVIANPMPADQPFAMQVTLQVKSVADDLIPQVFVSNSPDFSQDRATAAQELVWQLKGNEQKVVVAGRIEGQAALPAHAQTLTIRIVLNRDLAIVETDDHRLWAGPHSLGDGQRYVGVRFIRTAGKSTGNISIQSIRLQKS